MKKYISPIMIIDTFTPNEAVAVCDKLPTEKKYQAVTIECLATTSDNIFAASDLMVEGSSCKHIIDPDKNGTDYFFLPYTDKDKNPGSGLYFGWKNRISEGNSTRALEEVLRAAGKKPNAGNGQVWHCGRVKDDYMKQLYSHS